MALRKGKPVSGVDAPIDLPGSRKFQMVPPDDLKIYARNPRKNDHAVPVVQASIDEFGFRSAIEIDADGEIVAGHTRLKAALERGDELVPVIQYTDMRGQVSKAYRIAHNRTGEEARWDDGTLAQLLQELSENSSIDLTVLGFGTDELATLLELGGDADPPPTFPTVNTEGDTDFRCPKCHHEWNGKPRPN